RYLLLTLQIFAGLGILIYIVDLAELNRQLSGVADISFFDTVLISALRIPQILQVTIPFIILVSAMAALSNFNRRYELVVARSVGISAWQFLAPLCLASLVVGLSAVAMLHHHSSTPFTRAGVCG